MILNRQWVKKQILLFLCLEMSLNKYVETQQTPALNAYAIFVDRRSTAAVKADFLGSAEPRGFLMRDV